MLKAITLQSNRFDKFIVLTLYSSRYFNYDSPSVVRYLTYRYTATEPFSLKESNFSSQKLSTKIIFVIQESSSYWISLILQDSDTQCLKRRVKHLHNCSSLLNLISFFKNELFASWQFLVFIVNDLACCTNRVSLRFFQGLIIMIMLRNLHKPCSISCLNISVLARKLTEKISRSES